MRDYICDCCAAYRFEEDMFSEDVCVFCELEGRSERIKELEQRLAELEAENRWIPVSEEGQIKQGDWLLIFGKNKRDNQFVDAKDILTIDGNEEVIIDSELNRYFITIVYLEGKSWAKEILIYQAPQDA